MYQRRLLPRRLTSVFPIESRGDALCTGVGARIDKPQAALDTALRHGQHPARGDDAQVAQRRVRGGEVGDERARGAIDHGEHRAHGQPRAPLVQLDLAHDAARGGGEYGFSGAALSRRDASG